MNPFEAPNADPATRPDVDVHVNVAMALMFAAAAVWGALALFLVAAGVFLAAVPTLVPDLPQNPDDPPPIFAAIVALGEALFFAIPSALYAAAGYGLYARRFWGWLLAMCGFSLTLMGCLAPVGLYGFYALLREQPRRAFGLG